MNQMAALLVEDPVLRVEEFGGVFAIDPRSDLFERIAIFGKYEQVLTDAIRGLLVERSRAESTFDMIDVGANIGFHSVMFAKSGYGRVLAVEPMPYALARHRRNLDLNGVSDKCITYAGVASVAAGELVIHTISGKEEYSSLQPISHPATRMDQKTTQIIAAQTLDALVVEHGLRPGVIKIDAEGSEHLVLAGAEATVAKYKPAFVIEYTSSLLVPNSALSIIAWLERAGYRISDPLCPRRVVLEGHVGDIIAVPAKR
jgi:FkbM family methyltransferase